MSDQQTPAGWYPDPDNAGQQRYWDGTQWTDYHAAGQALTYDQTQQVPAKGTKTALIVLGAVLVAGVLVIGGIALLLSSDSDKGSTTAAVTTSAPTSPAPTTSAPAEPTPTAEPTEDLGGYALLNYTWHSESKSAREKMCIGYEISPDYLWKSFKAALDEPGLLTKAEFDAFMAEHC